MGYKLGASKAEESGAAAAGGGDADAPGASKPASIDALLAAEVAELKSKKTHAFKWHDTGVKSTVFVEFVKDSGELWRGGAAAWVDTQCVCMDATCSRAIGLSSCQQPGPEKVALF
jgi:hypothetical protein